MTNEEMKAYQKVYWKKWYGEKREEYLAKHREAYRNRPEYVRERDRKRRIERTRREREVRLMKLGDCCEP